MSVIVKQPCQQEDSVEPLFSCRTCGTLYRLDKKELRRTLEMWGFGAFAYFSRCPHCETKNVIEVPLTKSEISLYLYIQELERDAKTLRELSIPEGLRPEEV